MISNSCLACGEPPRMVFAVYLLAHHRLLRWEVCSVECFVAKTQDERFEANVALTLLQHVDEAQDVPLVRIPARERVWHFPKCDCGEDPGMSLTAHGFLKTKPQLRQYVLEQLLWERKFCSLACIKKFALVHEMQDLAIGPLRRPKARQQGRP